MPNPPRTITANGRTQTLDAWAAETGLSRQTICSRIELLKWTPERALATRADKRFRKGGRPRSNSPRAAPPLRKGTWGPFPDSRGRVIPPPGITGQLFWERSQVYQACKPVP